MSLTPDLPPQLEIADLPQKVFDVMDDPGLADRELHREQLESLLRDGPKDQKIWLVSDDIEGDGKSELQKKVEEVAKYGSYESQWKALIGDLFEQSLPPTLKKSVQNDPYYEQALVLFAMAAGADLNDLESKYHHTKGGNNLERFYNHAQFRLFSLEEHGKMKTFGRPTPGVSSKLTFKYIRPYRDTPITVAVSKKEDGTVDKAAVEKTLKVVKASPDLQGATILFDDLVVISFKKDARPTMAALHDLLHDVPEIEGIEQEYGGGSLYSNKTIGAMTPQTEQEKPLPSKLLVNDIGAYRQGYCIEYKKGSTPEETEANYQAVQSALYQADWRIATKNGHNDFARVILGSFKRGKGPKTTKELNAIMSAIPGIVVVVPDGDIGPQPHIK